MSILHKLNELLDKVNRGAIILITITIISTSFLNIVLRWFNTSLMFVDPLVRHLVFLLAFLGALEATERSQNISIDVLKRYLETKEKKKLISIIDKVILMLSILGCLWLAQSSYEFVKIEMQYPRELFWGISTGTASAIMPLGFSLLALKSFLRLLLSFQLTPMIGEVENG